MFALYIDVIQFFSNPGGKISAWLNTKLTTSLAPHYVKKLYEACLSYPKWKADSGNPQVKPWLYPEQITSDKIQIGKDVSWLNYSIFHIVYYNAMFAILVDSVMGKRKWFRG